LLSFAGATAPISSDQVAGSLSNQLSWSGALVIHTTCQCNPGSPMDTFLKSEEKNTIAFYKCQPNTFSPARFPDICSLKRKSPIVPLFNGTSGYVGRAEDYPCDNLNQTIDNSEYRDIADDYHLALKSNSSTGINEGADIVPNKPVLDNGSSRIH
jgi:hypothetical protein